MKFLSASPVNMLAPAVGKTPDHARERRRNPHFISRSDGSMASPPPPASEHNPSLLFRNLTVHYFFNAKANSELPAATEIYCLPSTE
jgi:hypothetical protein